MPRYFYKAKSLSTGEEKSGVLEAKDVHQLSNDLHRENLMLIKAELESIVKKRKFEISFFGPSLTEKMMFTRNLTVMVSAGIPLPRSLETLSGLVKSKKFRETLSRVKEDILQGKTFSESLAKYPDVFSELFVSMIRIGEETGTMENVLKNLTNQMEKEHDLKSKVMGALIYPAVIICAMLGIGFLMLVMVIPKLAETFEELNIALPATTIFIIKMGQFSAAYWYLVPLIIAAFVFLLKTILKTKIGKKIFDTISLKLPIVSSFIIKTNSAYTVRTLGSLISSGVPIVRSLEIISNSLGNSHYKNAILDVAEQVRKGGRLSDTLIKYSNIYPTLVIQMIEVGEETGQTSEILGKLADFYEDEVASATKNLSAIVEPVLMIIIGGVVGFFAISMVQPMYSMLGAI